VTFGVQDLQKQKEVKEEELIELRKVANEKKSTVNSLFDYLTLSHSSSKIISLCGSQGLE